jgi:chloride channel protein, CIC family
MPYSFNQIKRLKDDLTTQLILLGVLVGVLSGFGAVFFRWLITGVQSLAFGQGPDIIEVIRNSGWLRRLFMPALGGLGVGLIVKFFLKKSGSHGVPEVMEAVQQHGGKLPRRDIFFKALTAALTIGSGGSTGREGPIAHIGSAIGSAVSQLFKMKGELAKTMIGCGAAGGIAATFNAPIAGALFALEVIHGDVAIRHFTPVVISAVIATVVSNSLLKEVASFPALTSGQLVFNLKSGYEIPLYMAMAILAGVFSILFIKTLEFGEDKFRKLKTPNYLKPMIGGFMMALITFIFPQLHGLTNYETINGVFEGRYVWYLIGFWSLLKMVTTTLTLESGGSGGVFAPCLFIGAMMGGTFGYWVHRLFPQATASSGSYALVGMGAIMAGVTQAPLTSIVLIFELSGKYTIILPLMITCAVSTIIVHMVLNGSVFTLALKKKGIYYGEKRNVLRRMTVGEIIKREFISVFPQMHFKELLNTLAHSKQFAFPVLDPSGMLLGMVSLQDYQEMVIEQDLSHVVVVGDLMTTQVISVTLEESLEDALLKIGDRNIEFLPVLESQDSKKVIGIISRRDILTRYNSEIRELREQSAYESA